MADNRAWTRNKPTTPGYYLVRGYEVGHNEETACVEVGKDIDGELSCNLHEQNSNPDGVNRGFIVAGLHDGLEWCPLMPVFKQGRE